MKLYVLDVVVAILIAKCVLLFLYSLDPTNPPLDPLQLPKLQTQGAPDVDG